MWRLGRKFGPDYSPQTRQGMERLRSVAAESRPVQQALEQYRKERGQYPVTIADLFPVYLQPSNAPASFHAKDWGAWDYLRDGTNGYELYFQLNWDGGLWLEHSVRGTNRWRFGLSGDDTDLTREIELQ